MKTPDDPKIDPEVTEIRPRAKGTGVPSIESVREILDAITHLMFIEDPNSLFAEIARVIKDLFAFDQVVIWSIGEDGISVAKAAQGFSQAAMAGLSSISWSLEDDERAKKIATWVSPITFFIPGELVPALGYSKEVLEPFIDYEAAARPRVSPNSWHEMDFMEVRFLSREGRFIGSVEMRRPLDGLIPSLETIRTIEILVSISSVAIELARLREKEQAISGAAERRSAQITQVLGFAREVLSLESSEKVLNRILSILRDLFGFQAATISLLDEKENSFRYVALMGYLPEEMEYAKTLRIPYDVHKHFVMPDYLIGRNAYYLPAEELPEEDLLWEIYTPDGYSKMKERKHLPRAFPGAWHPQDNLSFVIHNRFGKLIGVLCPDSPRDGRIPPLETIDGVGIFTSLASIALENAKFYSESLKAKEEIEMLNGLLFHDVSILNGTIREYLELSTVPGTPREARIKYIRSAQQLLDSTVELIQKVRRLSSIRSSSSTELLRVDLAAAVRNQASRTMSQYPSRKVKQTFGVMPANCYVLANDLIGELLGNILSNAVVHNFSEEPEVEISIEGLVDEFSGKRYWNVSIGDNGPGIPEERKTQLFDITSRMRESDGRTGIGLSVVKAIATIYGGSIWVEDRSLSDYSKGSIFHVLLPAA